MNITILMMSGVVLIALLITATVNVAIKTVKEIRRYCVKNKIQNLLCEVTCKIACEKLFICTPFPEVAREVLSPKSPNSINLKEGWRYNGVNTSFILSNDNLPSSPTCFIYGKKRFLIWKIADKTFFKNDEGIYICLGTKATQRAEKLLEVARDLGAQALYNHAEKKKRLLQSVAVEVL